MIFAIELGIPLLIFTSRRLRHLAAAMIALFQMTIAITGNYGGFNLLTIILCLPLLDDRLVRGLIRLRQTSPSQIRHPKWRRSSVKRYVGCALLVTIVALVSVATFVREMVATQQPSKLPTTLSITLRACDSLLLSWAQPHVLDYTDLFRTISGYGLFRVMTTTRPEIAIEGSHDGREWTTYRFRWKPGHPKHRPRFVAPHQPRLDWQMWFAALNLQAHRSPPWLGRLLQSLLEGKVDMLALFEHNPFPGRPPAWVRLTLYHYQFTDTKRHSGAWWKRKLVWRSCDLTLPDPKQ